MSTHGKPLRSRRALSLAVLLLVALAAIMPALPALPPTLLYSVSGARHITLVCVVVVLLSASFGCLLGAVAALRGFFWDGFASHLLEAASTFPAIAFLAILRSVDRQHAMRASIIALLLIRTPAVARLVRSHLFALVRSDFILAARALGAPPHRLLLRHALPLLAPALIQSSLTTCAIAIGLDTALAFTGLSTQGPGYSWGTWLGSHLASHDLVRASVPALFSVLTLTSLLTLADLHEERPTMRTTDDAPLR